jgi:uncharacterized protein
MRLRRATRVAAAILALGAPWATSSRAASFDCAKASHPDETAVCSSPALSTLDVRMMTLYEVVLKLVAMGVRADLQDQQRAFLAARATCGADAACIAALYDQRIASLQKVIDDIAARGPY